MTLRLRTFGSVYLSRNGEILTGAAGQRRLLAILTVLAAVGEHGISRDKLLALLWSEGEPDKSRHALTQSLYHIRKALDAERIFLNGADLRINPEALSSDVGDFQCAIVRRDLDAAVSAYAGPFLDGFYLNGDPEFDFWVSNQRDRFARQFSDVLQSLAESAQAAGDRPSETRWRTKLADHDPLNGPAVAALMTSLIASGDHATALQRARAYESRLKVELDLPPDRAVTDLVAVLRRRSTVSSQAAAGRDLAADARAVSRDDDATPVAALDGNAMLEAVGPAASTIAPRLTGAPPRPKRWMRSTPLLGGILIAAGLVVAAARAAVSHIANDRAEGLETTILIAPFHTDESNAAASYLREGFLDLLSTRLSDADRKRAADPTRVLHAWRLAGFDRSASPAVGSVARLARDLEAGEAVTGSLDADGSNVRVHAALIDASSARVKATVDVSGSADSLMSIADRIINGLLLTEAGARLADMPQPPTVSPLALRAYLTGRAEYRQADYYGAMRAYNQALVEDPSFALAALGLSMSADHVNAAEQHDRGLAIAWARRDQLPEAQRAFLIAFAGPNYPEPSSAADVLAAWEHVVHVVPDLAEGWAELGESFYYDGDLLGLTDALPRAADAFQRALSLDPSYTPALRMLTLLRARQNDTTALRRLVPRLIASDSGDAMNVFVRWRAAQALGDARELAHLRRSFDDAPNGALRAIAMTAQFDGVSVADGDRALAILGRRALTDVELVDVALARHSRALNAADYATALAITNDLARYRPALHPQLRMRVLDALYSKGNRAAAQSAAADLARLTARRAPASAADTAVRLADLCVLGQWRLSLGDTGGVRSLIGPLRAARAPRIPVALAANPLTCAELLDVSLALDDRGPAARERLAHLDSLMLSGPAVGDAMRYANLVVARAYQRLGDPQRGLAALHRRSFMRGWPRYRATGLALQVELALASGDTAAARNAAQRLKSTAR